MIYTICRYHADNKSISVGVTHHVMSLFDIESCYFKEYFDSNKTWYRIFSLLEKLRQYFFCIRYIYNRYICNTFRHSLGTIQGYMAWNFLPSYLVYILYCVWKVKASKAQAGFRLMLFYKSQINFRLQFKFRIKERKNSTVHHITVSSFLYNWWIIRKPYQCGMLLY